MGSSLTGCSKSDLPQEPVIIDSIDDNNDVPPPVVITDSLPSGWRQIKYGNSYITDVFFIRPDLGYLVSEAGLSKSTDGGLTWSKTWDQDSDFLFVAPDGKVFTIAHNKLHYSNDGGKTFTLALQDNITDLFFVSPDIGYVPVNGGGLFQTNNGGISWNLVKLDTVFRWGINTIPYFFDKNTGWIGTSMGVYRTAGSINTWDTCAFDIPPGFNYQNTGSIVHAVTADSVFVSVDGTLYRSIDGGKNFKKIIKLGGQWQYNDIHFVDAREGYYLTSNSVYKTTNGGDSWERVVFLKNASLVELHFSDRDHGWVVGAQGLVLVYNRS